MYQNLNNDVKTLKLEKKSLTEQLENQKLNLAGMTKLAMEYNEKVTVCQDIMLDMASELADYGVKAQEFREQYDKLKTTISFVEKTADERESKLSQLQSAYEHAKRENETMVQNTRDSKEALENADRENRSLTDLIRSLNVDMTSMENERDTYRRERNAMQVANKEREDENKRAVEEMEKRHTAEMLAMTDKLRKAEEAFHAKELEFIKSQQDHTQKMEQINSLTTEVTRLSNELKQLESNHSQLTKDHKDLSGERDELQKELEKAKTDAQNDKKLHADQIKARLEDEKKSFSTRLGNAENERNRAEKELENTKLDLKNKVQEAEAQSKEIQSLQARTKELSEMQEAMKKLQQEKKELQSGMDKAKQKAEEDQNKIQSLMNKHKEAKQAKADADADLRSKDAEIQQLKDQLNDSQNQVRERKTAQDLADADEKAAKKLQAKKDQDLAEEKKKKSQAKKKDQDLADEKAAKKLQDKKKPQEFADEKTAKDLADQKAAKDLAKKQEQHLGRQVNDLKQSKQKQETKKIYVKPTNPTHKRDTFDRSSSSSKKINSAEESIATFTTKMKRQKIESKNKAARQNDVDEFNPSSSH